MKLYNTLTKKPEEVAPIDNNSDNEIGLYSCGPTVYDFTHLGHLRKYTMDDVLVRALRADGFRVKHVENITDVGHLTSDSDTGEDKLEKGAKKYKMSVWDLAHKFENFFWHSMDLMGNAKPDISCKATDHIEEQLEMVKTLETKGFTYVIEGDGVYFDTSKLDDYGKLARLNIEELREGARIASVEGKKNLTDFALWKFEREGESRAMVWPSPWHERSFPGWHIECSAMSIAKLGEQFEIHTGGIDHIPVHHTNEIAQAEATTGKKPFVKIWVHHNFLQVESEKMSKSLGNFFTIDDVIERGFDPMALRLLFLSVHYKGELNFTWDNLAGTQKAWQKLNKFIQYVLKSPEFKQSLSSPKSVEAKKYRDQFFANINNDLSTPQALATLWEMIKDETLSEEDRYLLLLEFDQVLGLGLESIMKNTSDNQEIPSEVQTLLDERQKARQARDWPKSDELRGEIAELGFRVLDRELEQVVESLQGPTL
jgi:cysteinyl-tRNA synthetase